MEWNTQETRQELHDLKCPHVVDRPAEEAHGS